MFKLKRFKFTIINRFTLEMDVAHAAGRTLRGAKLQINTRDYAIINHEIF